MVAEPGFPDRARHALIGALMLGLACGQPATAATSTIGRTWPIAEPDAMTEIEARAAKAPSLASRLGPRSNWSALQAAPVGQARLLYPKGFTFNPLDYVSLPQRLVIVHPRDLGWALKQARFTDFILLTAGDALDLSERSGRPLFILEERVKERLGLIVAPVIVAQQGKKLVLNEYAPLRTADGRARP